MLLNIHGFAAVILMATCCFGRVAGLHVLCHALCCADQATCFDRRLTTLGRFAMLLELHVLLHAISSFRGRISCMERTLSSSWCRRLLAGCRAPPESARCASAPPNAANASAVHMSAVCKWSRSHHPENSSYLLVHYLQPMPCRNLRSACCNNRCS